jgi:PAS domain S-box-containing protein
MKQIPANFRKQHRRSGRGLLTGVWLLQLLLAGRALALDPAKDVLQYNCRTWNRQNGLPASDINAIAQTKDGYLWFGTSAGLLRFDGIEFKLLDFHSVANVRNSVVTSLSSARSGGLWVGLENSAFGFYDGQSFSLRSRTNAEMAVLNVRSILEAKDGTVWLAAQEQAGRLNRSGELEPVLKSDSATNLFLNVLCGYEDRHGRLWFGTADQGVYCWQDGKITRLSDPKLNATSVLGIAEDGNGKIWVGTSIGLFCYDASLQRQEIPPLYEEVRALLVDRQGVLWIGTSGRGLARYQQGTYGFLERTDGLASDYVKAIAEDHEGNLWVGTRDGISQISDVKFPIQHAAEDLKVKDAIGVGPSQRGGVWIASSGGVTRFDPKTKTYTTQSGLTNSYVKRVFEASNGDLYVVNGTHNLVVFSSGKVVATYAAPNMIVGMAEDEQGVVVSVGGKLYRAGTNYFRPYTFNNGEQPPFYWIVNLASGRDGVIWVACGNGIFRVKDGACQHWSAAEGLSDPIVQSVCEDQDGVVWAGLLSGIVRLKDNHIRLINRKNGLFDDNIYAIVPDDLGNLWVDSGRGIFRVVRQTMNDFADGKTDRVECMIFDGIESVKVADKTEQQRVGCKTADGRIWFPSPLGVVMIDPAHIPINRMAPPVHIDRIRANRKEFLQNEQAVVPPGEGELEFHYNALSFIAPQKAQFQYRLEAYDKDWVDAGDRRMAFYTNLKPGRYIFRVIAANADGVWNETGDALKIELRPHYYQTAWFRLLCGGLAFAALIGIYLQRVRHLKLKQQQLQKTRDLLEVKVQERTSELRNEIEERKRAEETIASERQLLRTLIDVLPETVYIKDLDSRFLVVNETLAKVLGKDTPSQVLGLSDADIYPAGLAAEFRAEEMKIFAGEPLINQENTMVSPDGRERTMLTTKLPFRDGQGRICGLVGIGHDITERKRAEEVLRESEQRFRALFEGASEGVFQSTPGGQYCLANPALAKMLGYASSQELIAGVTDIGRQLNVDPGVRAEFQRRIAEQGEVQNFEFQACRKDGATIWLSENAHAVRDASGAVLYYEGILQNITERKRAEEAMRESEERFSGAFEHAPIGVALVSPDGRYLKINRVLCDLVGYSEAELLTRTFQDITHPEDLEVDLENVRRVIAGEIRSYQMEKRYIHARGHLVTVLLNVSLVRDGQGRPRYFISQVQDITERKRLEVELTESQGLYHSLVEQLPANVWRKDAAGRFTFANSRFCRFKGKTADEILGQTAYAINPKEVADQIIEEHELIMRTGKSIEKEESCTQPDGTVQYLQVMKAPVLAADGKIIGSQGIQFDITGRKRLEAQLVQSQKLETVGKLAGGVAHEFNSIMTAIIGHSELMLGDLPSGHPLSKNAAGIRRAAERAATLTRQLLAYGRRAFLRPESLDLNQVMANMEGMVRQLMGTDVDVRIVPAEGLRAVKADAGQIEQVIMNLAMNARDAMPNGGKLTLETANVSFDQERVGRDPELKPGNYVMLAIADTGTGMSEEVKARAFEPFFTTKDVGQGTGLGLSTCYGIIKQSGGHISVYTELGRGTTFKIYLPQVESQTKIPLQRLDSPDLPRGTETILLVEDDPALREMAATLLKRLGYTVLAAANGIEALSLKPQRDNGPIDLLFTDVVMPHMSGKELADRVQALHPHTRILFTSAYTENAIVHQGVLNPGVALLQKPFTPSALAHKLREVLDQPGAPKPDPAQKTSGFTKISDEAKTPVN